VLSVAYSPDGCHIISGSCDHTIRIWDAEAGPAACKPHSVKPIAYSLDGRHIVSESCANTTCVRDAFSYAPIRPSSRTPIHPEFFAKPNMDGWVRDSEGGLLTGYPMGVVQPFIRLPL